MPRKSVAVVGIGLGLEVISIKNQKESKRVIYINAISMLFENDTSTHTCV